MQNIVKVVTTILMPRITTIICATLLWSSILFNIAYAQDEIIKCVIRDGSSVIHLNLEKTDQLLANKHLPVWTANRRESTHCRHEGAILHELKPNLVSGGIDEFIFYHDKEKCAAFVLFRTTELFYGMIDTRYDIVGLPLKVCHEGVNIGQYVKHIDCPTMNPEGHIKPIDLPMDLDAGSVVGLGTASMFNDSRSITYLYPEIMVFVAYDKVKIVREVTPNNYLERIVVAHIIYFNAIDMLISKLSTDDIKLHINLAGIIVEDHENAFDFLHPYYGNPNNIDVNLVPNLFLSYVWRNLPTVSQDSFDFYFISTSKKLVRAQDRKYVNGMASNANIYDWKCNHMLEQRWPGVITMNDYVNEYIRASHEIAHLFSIQHDPTDKGYCNGRTQCYAIMQQVDQFCPDCMKWSDKSVNDVRMYARHNPDRCYLLNRPRSLHPYGSRIRTLSPSDQCRFYGFEPQTPNEGHEDFDIITNGGCARRLICGGTNKKLPLPIDGTPCGNDTVCWDRICQPMLNDP